MVRNKEDNIVDIFKLVTRRQESHAEGDISKAEF